MRTVMPLLAAHSHNHGDLPMVADVLLHSVMDTALMLPFLFVAYLLIEYIEHKKSRTVQRVLAKGGRFGFVPGAVLGIIPQCGFSAMAANFYASRVVTLGTLLAVFLATSDEAIPIMLANPQHYPAMFLLIGAKLVWALFVGLMLDVVLRRFIPQRLRGGYGGGTEELCSDHQYQHDHKGSIVLAALKHTVNIFLIVLAITFVFGLLVEWLGEEQVGAALSSLGVFQPVVAALFGLIPNCASSVLLTQLYLAGSISFGSVFAGLSANAGIGLTVLFRANRSIRQNLFILALLFALGVVPGLVLHLAGV